MPPPPSCLHLWPRELCQPPAGCSTLRALEVLVGTAAAEGSPRLLCQGWRGAAASTPQLSLSTPSTPPTSQRWDRAGLELLWMEPCFEAPHIGVFKLLYLPSSLGGVIIRISQERRVLEWSLQAGFVVSFWFAGQCLGVCSERSTGAEMRAVPRSHRPFCC